MRFATGGKIDQTLIDIVGANVREPVQVIGDLHSLATCNDVGCRRLVEMMDEFAIAGLETVATHILARSEAATLEEIDAARQQDLRILGEVETLEIAAVDRLKELASATKQGMMRHQALLMRKQVEQQRVDLDTVQRGHA